MMALSRVQYVCLCVATLLMMSGVWWRSEIGLWWWQTTQTVPKMALLLHPDASFAYELAQHYFVTEDSALYDVTRAEYFYQETIRLNSQHPTAQYQLARIAFITDRQLLALERVNAHIDTHADALPEAYYLRGLIHGFLGDVENGIADFETFLTYGSTDWYPYNNLAWLHFREGNYQSMYRYTQQGLSLHPNNPWLLMSRAMAQHNLANTAAARADMLAAEAAAANLTEQDWLTTYPGNDPAIAAAGLEEFLAEIQKNKAILY